MIRTSLIAEESMMMNNARDAVGKQRNNKRWASYNSMEYSVKCPWCEQINNLHGSNLNNLKKARKKVPLTVLLCPHCYAVWQYRGTLPEEVSCPVCSKSCKPLQGNTGKGAFICPSCGTKDKIINSIRKLPKNQLLPTRPYAVEGYCAECAGDNEELDMHGDLLKRKKIITHQCNIHNNRGKFFKRITPADLKKYQNAERRWAEEKDRLPYPKSEIPMGEKTKSGLIAHNYKYWHQMFNSRQLLCLSMLLKEIGEENDQVLKEMLLSGFYSTLESNNTFCRYTIAGGNKSQGIFSRHDYQPKLTFTENNPWGGSYGHSTFYSNFKKVVKGKEFCYSPFDRNIANGKFVFEERDEKIQISEASEITCGNSQNLTKNGANLVITDPPYAGNVNYSELADFFYVWLRLILSRTYPHFAPEITPKAEEIIENPTRGKTTSDYQEDLTEVWRRCCENLKDNGLMVFTFHHREGKAWEALLDSLCTAGLVIEAIYPIHGESESSLHLMGNKAIAYDLIHICKKRNGQSDSRQRSWAGVREEIRKKARKEIDMIEAGRYGKEKLSTDDLNIILIGKCLELYSRHYGMIVDYKGDVVPLGQALTSIRMMVEQIVYSKQPLPSELEHIDPVSYIYLTCLCDRKEIKSDEVRKTTLGIMEPEALIKAGVIRKGRAKRGRTYEVKLPVERYKDLTKLFKSKSKTLDQLLLFPELEEARFDNVALVDVLHYLMGLAEAGENLVPWLNEFKPVVPNIRVSFEYLLEKNPTFQGPINKVLSIIEV
jgi:adenine-specific DNA methylase